MDPLSMIGMGTNILGGLFSAFGGSKTKNDWIKNPYADKFLGAAEQTNRMAQDRAQSVANLGAFKDSQTNQRAANAGAGALAQAGGSYSGAQMNALSAGNIMNKATNYSNTMEGAAQAAGMRNQADESLMNRRGQYADFHALQQTKEPDFLSRLGMGLSGMNNSALTGAAAGRDLMEMFGRGKGGYR